MVLQVLMMAVLARLVAPEAFGLVASTTLVYSFLALFSEIIIAPALIQREAIDSRHIKTGFAAVVGFGFLASLLLSYSGSWLEALLMIDGVQQTVPFMALVLYFHVIGSIPDALCVRELNLKAVALSEAAAYTFGYIAVALPLAYLGYGIWALIFGMIAKTGLRAAFLLYLKRAQLGFMLDGGALADVTRVGWGFALTRLFNMLATQGDNVIVGRELGAASLGLYDRAYLLMKLPASLYQRIASRVFFSAMSRVQSDAGRFRSGFERGVQLGALVGLPLSAALFVMSREWVLVLFGEAWSAMIPVFAIMSAAAYPRLAYKTLVSVLNARGKMYLTAGMQVLFAFLVISAALLGTSFGDLRSVAVFISIAVLLNWMALVVAVLHACKLSLRTFIRMHVPGTALAFLVLLTGTGIGWAVPDQLGLWGDFVLKGGGIVGVLLLAFASGSRLLLGEHGTWLRGEIGGHLPKRLRWFSIRPPMRHD